MSYHLISSLNGGNVNRLVPPNFNVNNALSAGAGNENRPSFSRDGSRLAITSPTAPQLRVYDTSDWSLVSGTPTISTTYCRALWSANGDRLFCFPGTSVVVYDTSTWAQVTSFSVGAEHIRNTITGAGISKSGDTLVVQGSNAEGRRGMAIINTNDYSVRAAADTPSYDSSGAQVTFVKNDAYCLFNGGGSFRVLDTSTWTVVSGSLSVSSFRHGIAVNSSETYCWISRQYGRIRLLNISDSNPVNWTVINADWGVGGGHAIGTADYPDLALSLDDAWLAIGTGGAATDPIYLRLRDVSDASHVNWPAASSALVPPDQGAQSYVAFSPALFDFSVAPTVTAVTPTAYTVGGTLSESGSVFAVATLTSDVTDPTNVQIVAGLNGAGAAAPGTGSATDVTAFSFSITGASLADNAVHDIHVVGRKVAS